eukprot:m.177656 g.177656  ORF g.177656 m.177656 type:complete len:490 (-) comp24497_c0_seq2:323-1792(-)
MGANGPDATRTRLPRGGMLARLCLLAAALCESNAAPSLRLVQMIFRHGDRSAIHVIPTLPPVHWPQGLGQLSAIGMQQQFAAGFGYRQRYGNLVGWTYNSSAVEVRSTDVNRCLVSAESQLAGWFPQNVSVFPTNFPIAAPVWLPIPVHTVPTSSDSLLRPFDRGSCPKYTAWRDALPTSQTYATKRAETVPPATCRKVGLTPPCIVSGFITKVGVLSGLPQLDIATLWQVVDTLFCRSQHNVTIFPWAAADNNHVLDYLMELESWSMYSEFNSSLARKLTGGNMISELVKNAHAMFDPTTNVLNLTTVGGGRKLMLYSAHDTTVAALISALDPNRFGMTASPPYASAMIVEMWADQSLGSAFFRLRFQNHTSTTTPNNLTITDLVLPGCTADCPVETFARLLSDVTPANWTNACKIQHDGVASHSVGTTSASVVVVVVVALLALVAVGAVFFYRGKEMRQNRHHLIEVANDYDMTESFDAAEAEEEEV